MANTITGKIVSIGNAVNVSKNKEFMKRELVLDASRYDPITGEKRPNVVSLSFQQRNCDKLNDFHVGDVVDVSFVLQGREYDREGGKRIFTDVVAYNIANHGGQGGTQQPSAGAGQAPQAPQAPQIPHAPAAPVATPPQGGTSSDLPF